MKIYFENSSVVDGEKGKIVIERSPICGDATVCPNRHKCKYGKKHNYWFSNLCVSVRNAFKRNFNIDLPESPFIVANRWECFSGTKKCPHSMPKNYTCYDCKYLGWYDFDECNCKERYNVPFSDTVYRDENWGNQMRCKFFEPFEGLYSDN